MTPRLSQHFLHDPAVAARIAGAVEAPAGGRVVEIGPGRGALTGPLLERGFRVRAIELDAGLAAELRDRWAGEPRLTVVEGDAIEAPLSAEDAAGPLWVAGNLPYAITSPLLFRVLDEAEESRIAGLVFMIQREVAERLAAEPGTKAYGALTVGVRLVADVERLFDVGTGAFQPPPGVVSTVVRLIPHDRHPLDTARAERVRALVRDLFGQRRKQIQKALRTLPGWDLEVATVARVAERTGIDLGRRPETLSIEEFLALEAGLAASAFSTPEGSGPPRDVDPGPPPNGRGV